MDCTISGISYDGAGVARVDGRAVFVPFAIPGETVEIDIVAEKNRYSLGKLLKILEPSPDRAEPVCPHYFECGGCSYQHVNYSAQLKYKRQVVVDNITRIGKIAAEVKNTIGMDNPWRYRNKVTWHVKDGKLGYYAENTTNLVPIKTCPLIIEPLEEVSRVLARQLSRVNNRNNGEVVIRQSSVNNEIMMIFSQVEVTPKLLNPLKDYCASIYKIKHKQFEHLYGKSFLQEKINNLSFQLSPGSFFQVNHTQTLILIDKVLEYLNLQKNENILDAYCGIGSISLPLAQKCGSVIGVESFAAAVEDAKNNAMLNNIENCEFISGACEKILPKLNKKFDAVVLDPPRSGCKKEVISAITDTDPSRIVYVSCNPATLARDLAVFTEQGYSVDEVQPVDMFPNTRHVECVIMMTNSGSKGK